MTPKEKAQHLVDVYSRFSLNTKSITNHLEYSKKLALISVDEIWNYVAVIEQHETADCAFGGSFDGDEYFKYLQQVKQEINAL